MPFPLIHPKEWSVSPYSPQPVPMPKPLPPIKLHKLGSLPLYLKKKSKK